MTALADDPQRHLKGMALLIQVASPTVTAYCSGDPLLLRVTYRNWGPIKVGSDPDREMFVLLTENGEKDLGPHKAPQTVLSRILDKVNAPMTEPE
ncbi:hypothetical protein [Spirillospora sp. NPDC047279]|uniref:hypothetical protein n=1 Tax=Spirillospora sp. NPDC047279 TaxID=3155478 RepID=UPI0033EF614D